MVIVSWLVKHFPFYYSPDGRTRFYQKDSTRGGEESIKLHCTIFIKRKIKLERDNKTKESLKNTNMNLLKSKVYAAVYSSRPMQNFQKEVRSDHERERITINHTSFRVSPPKAYPKMQLIWSEKQRQGVTQKLRNY